jgi:hypothetical protein
MNDTPDSRSLVYRIDSANRITWVNSAWSEFARSNHGEAVMPEHVLGQDLFASITDPALRQIYRSIIERVRAGATVNFSYCCDAPDKRRVYDMEVHLLPDGGEEFVSTLKHEEARPSVAVLVPGGVRSKLLIRVCSWCQKVAMPDERWLPVEQAVAELRMLEALQLPAISHGICPPCHAAMMVKLRPA